MTQRKHTPLHDYWHPRVEGQIRDCMHHHPLWFNLPQPIYKKQYINSLAKRIVGEIIVGVRAMPASSEGLAIKLSFSRGCNGDCILSLPGEGYGVKHGQTTMTVSLSGNPVG